MEGRCAGKGRMWASRGVIGRKCGSKGRARTSRGVSHVTAQHKWMAWFASFGCGVGILPLQPGSSYSFQSRGAVRGHAAAMSAYRARQPVHYRQAGVMAWRMHGAQAKVQAGCL
eukprot:365154-Chlamydomonas_euryale.AAC.10